MDDHYDREPTGQLKLVELAASMLRDEINLIEGVRRICVLRFATGDPDDEVFLSIRSIDSQTDEFPIGAMRSNCSIEYLTRADEEMKHFLNETRDDIFRACSEIVNKFS